MTVWRQMFLARTNLACGRPIKHSEVLEAVRAATPESRATFGAQYGEIAMEVHIFAADYQGGWVERLRDEARQASLPGAF